MLNDAVVAPAGIVTLDAVGAAIVLLLVERATTVPPAGAAHSSVTVPLTVDPPVAGFGESASVFARIGRTVTLSVLATPPKLAVRFPVDGVVTVLVVTVNVAVDAPPATVTLAGALALVFVFDSVT